MLLHDVVDTARTVAATSSRTAKVEALAACLRRAADDGPETVEVVASHLSGVLPQRRIGVSWRGLTGLPDPASEPSLTVEQVDAAATRIAAIAGSGSGAARSTAVGELFAAATADEQTWLRGLITGETRQGAGDGVMLQAVAKAADVPDAAVRRAVMLAGFTGPVARAALEGGAPALEALVLEVGRPLRPMLAGSAPDVAGALATLGGQVLVEAKLDGIRLQAHVDDGEVHLYTRTLDEVTDRMPEIVEALAGLTVRRAVLDGEVIALRSDGRPQPFQVTGARTASSQDPARLRDEVPLTPFFFDVLHLDGDDLVDEPAAVRWRRLAETVPPGWLVPRLLTDDPTEGQQFFDDLVLAGHEGVVVKDPALPYAAGRRGPGWVKVKPRHTLDLVVLAVEWGSGRRTGKLSNIHLGARDADTGELVMLGKTFKGMTDEMLAWQTERFLDLAVERGDRVVTVRPEQVVEIAFDGVQKSTRYPGGMALRFARVLRYRDDKPVSEIDTVQGVRALAGW
ncbi:ATP-dependent DNA ligase [Terracoccus luteus]|uniref:Probable DNA ligase n=1 Tax=Terracoccus luteus TaxID=53356 RepID=A0A495XQ27_9MICO|nr:ATP-dependent DNA ligase [Terracoccus luteus]MBB2988432.1 DNA ligase-1 [Terracoccus luteus]MCP2174041.1 DNA ligase-1 [Terracoccus luteus]RKT76701.1 DNA ligase-1 [Terracoccus luteus]